MHNTKKKKGLPSSSMSYEPACNAEDLGSIPGLERSPGVGNGNPLQSSCLENPMDRGAWGATVHGVTKSQTRLSAHKHATLMLRERIHLCLHLQREKRTGGDLSLSVIKWLRRSQSWNSNPVFHPSSYNLFLLITRVKVGIVRIILELPKS